MAILMASICHTASTTSGNVSDRLFPNIEHIFDLAGYDFSSGHVQVNKDESKAPVSRGGTEELNVAAEGQASLSPTNKNDPNQREETRGESSEEDLRLQETMGSHVVNESTQPSPDLYSPNTVAAMFEAGLGA